MITKLNNSLLESLALFILGLKVLTIFFLTGCQNNEGAWEQLHLQLSTVQKKSQQECRFDSIPSVGDQQGTTDRYERYRCTLKPQQCFDECFANDPSATGPSAEAANACYSLAVAIQQRAENNPREGFRSHDAFAVFEQACANGHRSGCTHYAARIGRYAPNRLKQQECGQALLRQTCQAGESMGCLTMGGHLISLGSYESRAEGVSLLQKACQVAPLSTACDTAANILLSMGADLKSPYTLQNAPLTEWLQGAKASSKHP